MMHKKILISLLWVAMLVSTSLIAKPTAVFACSCAEQPTVDTILKNELSNKTAIFTGKVVNVMQPSKKLVMSSDDPVRVDFVISKVWKGELKQQVRIYTAMSSASCGYEDFNVGDSYLVSAYDSNSNHWSLYNSSNQGKAPI